jgi:glutaredoxin
MSYELRKAAEDALKLLEEWAVQIDGEWGMCRDLEELERDGRLPEEILALRRVLR